MEKVGILVVSYGSREAAITDALSRSRNYATDIYVVDKQKNPLNLKKSKDHVVIPDLNIRKISRFAKKHRDRIDFAIVGPEKPIIEGIRDTIEKETGIPVICPKKEFAIEGSKVAQRCLFQEIVPEANPRFKIFDPKDFKSLNQAKTELFNYLDELQDRVAVKPDGLASGKGVGVWGDHFVTRKQLFEHFSADYRHGPVIVEEKLEGEESSFQAFCDGKHLVSLPDTRDYKRAFDGDRGPNTGGMGSYKDTADFLPFMDKSDWIKETEMATRIFRKLKGEGRNQGLLGIPFYLAFMHTKEGPKILENNSRPGDPEMINILPIMKDDFVDVCFKILEGNLTRIELEKSASVVTYKVPPNYGGYTETFPNLVRRDEVNRPVDLSGAYELSKKYGDNIRVYPGSMEQRDSETFALKSRAVCIAGIGDSLQIAREISLEGVNAINGGALWNRTDIASKQHVEKSVKHMNELRRKR